MRPVILRYGLLAGAILAGSMVLTAPFGEQIGFEYAAIIGYTTMVLAFLMIWFGVRGWRDTVGGGHLTFGQGIAIGLGITAVATVCYALAWEFVYRTFLPDFMQGYADYTLAKAKAAGATEASLAAQRADLDAFAASYSNPLVRLGFSLLEPLPVSVLFTALSAWRLRRVPAGDGPRA